MKSGIILRSESGEADCVTIDAQQQGRVINCPDADNTTVIEGFTITNGSIDGLGGGIACGGLYTICSPTIIRCTFSNNNASGMDWHLVGGGGMCLQSGSPTLIDCSFTGNFGVNGGGLYSGGSNPTFVRCTFTDNTGNRGGGLRSLESDVTLINCFFSNNTASFDGGGICDGLPAGQFSYLSLFDCTITDNVANGQGGGVFLGYQIPPAETILGASNTDIRANTASEGPDGWVDNHCTALLTCCDIDLNKWVGNVTLDNSGCGVATDAKTWGSVKAMYR
jgi:hypothetical protein